MANKGTILVGTIGQGVMMSRRRRRELDAGQRAPGMHSDGIVKALLA